MKYSYVILCFLLNINFAFTICSDEGIWVYPESGEISPNSNFIVYFYGWDQEKVIELESKYTLNLKSSNHEIPLCVDKIALGKYIIQVIMSPDKSLIFGEEYKIYMYDYSLNKQTSFNHYNPLLKKHEENSYSCLIDVDNEPPKIIHPIKYESSSVMHFGCGDYAYSFYNIFGIDVSPIIVHTMLEDIKSKDIQNYYLIVKDNKIKVGFNFCHGSFKINSKVNYNIKFSISDLSGNSINNWTKWEEFENPYKYDVW